MSDCEDCCAPLAYVYGGISLSPKPPGQFTIGVRVNVGSQQVPVTGPDLGDDYALWHYLAIVKPGQARVICTVGDLVSIKNVEAGPDVTTIVNFCFGKPVVSSSVKGLAKAKARRKEREKIVERGPPGGEGAGSNPSPPA